jgi:hypothetical protein
VSVCALAMAVSRFSILAIVTVQVVVVVVIGVTTWSSEAVGTLGMGALGHRRQGYAH